MTRRIFATAIVTASVVAFWGMAVAQTGSSTTGPTQADFDHCNQQAQMSAGASASPRAAGGTSLGTPGVGMSSNVSGGTGVTAGSPGAGALGTSTSGAAVQHRSGAAGGSTSAAGAGGASGSSLSGGSTLSATTGTSADAQLRGMGPAGQSDTAYQAAYRECMRSRGF